MNNKKQPPEVFYKKAVLKKFSLFTRKYVCSSGASSDLQLFKKNIAKFLKKLILKKICGQLLLNNIKQNYSSMKIGKKMLNIPQHWQENT